MEIKIEQVFKEAIKKFEKQFKFNLNFTQYHLENNKIIKILCTGTQKDFDEFELVAEIKFLKSKTIECVINFKTINNKFIFYKYKEKEKIWFKET